MGLRGAARGWRGPAALVPGGGGHRLGGRWRAGRAWRCGKRAGGVGMRALVLGGGGRWQRGGRRGGRQWPALGGPAVADVGLTSGGLAGGVGWRC
jgi:hypothetical protein